MALTAGDERHKRRLGALFLTSGFAALLYQVVWQRALFAIFGINIESVTITVSAFLLGLGVGSIAGGIASKRTARPIRLFAAVELGVALFGLISLPLFRATGSALLRADLFTTGVTTMALLLVPTLLMGMTLPLLVASEVAEGPGTGRTVGDLYFVNTIGSAAASFLSVTALMPFLGEQRTVYVAVCLNIVVALAALRLARGRYR